MDSCSSWLQNVVRHFKDIFNSMDLLSLAVWAAERLCTLRWVVCSRGMLMCGGGRFRGSMGSARACGLFFAVCVACNVCWLQSKRTGPWSVAPLHLMPCLPMMQHRSHAWAQVLVPSGLHPLRNSCCVHLREADDSTAVDVRVTCTSFQSVCLQVTKGPWMPKHTDHCQLFALHVQPACCHACRSCTRDRRS